jgi:hypothetical protein
MLRLHTICIAGCIAASLFGASLGRAYAWTDASDCPDELQEQCEELLQQGEDNVTDDPLSYDLQSVDEDYDDREQEYRGY